MLIFKISFAGDACNKKYKKTATKMYDWIGSKRQGSLVQENVKGRARGSECV